MKKEKIIATNLQHLKKIVKREIQKDGLRCDLNHVDISQITDLTSLFYDSKFNGDISQWDTSNVTNMWSLFQNSSFNGDISRWNVSKVVNMVTMFEGSKFSGDISLWDVSHVKIMLGIFKGNKNINVENWKPYRLQSSINLFDEDANMPYWANYNTREDIKRAIQSYELQKKLDSHLNVNINLQNKNKI